MKRFILPPPPAAGPLYSSLVISPQTIAQRASSSRALSVAADLCRRLSHDDYTEYVTRYYEQGLRVAGEDWHFMDIVSVLLAVGELGQPENYLEIGVRRGRSVCALISASPATDVYAFDMWQESYGNNENPGPSLVRQELAKFCHSGRLTFIDGDSHVTLPRFFAENPELTFDVITVDGDHSLRGAWEDLRTVAPRVRVGGVLVFDDTANPYCPGLDTLWADLLESDRGFRGFSYNALGPGVSFAVRAAQTPFQDVRRSALRRLRARRPKAPAE